MGLNDSTAESKAYADAILLGGEEGDRPASHEVRRQARAIIRDQYLHKTLRAVPHLDLDRTTASDGMGRILDEVYKNLFDLKPIDQNR